MFLMCKQTFFLHHFLKVGKPGDIGRPPTLPPHIEEKLVETTKKAAAMGFGLSKKQLFIKTGKVVKNLNLKTPFKRGLPGNDWFIGLKVDIQY